jgi:hypothetical protein
MVNRLGAQLSEQFGNKWWQGTDFIIGSSSDSAGMHYFIARESEGYYWRPLASILPGGSEAGAWSGYFCVSGDSRYILATVAPLLASNYPNLEDRGALAYVIDIATGQVKPLVAGVAMYYDTPGCGTADTAALEAFPGSDESQTELLTVDLAHARLVRRQLLAGQFTSAVPITNGIAAYSRGAVDAIGIDAIARPLARVDGVAYDLTPDAGGGLDYLTTTYGPTAQAWDLTAGRMTHVGTGSRTALQLFAGAAGHNILAGEAANPAMQAQARAAGLVIRTAIVAPGQMSASRQGIVTQALQVGGSGAARLQPVPVLTSALTGKTVSRPLPAPAPASTAVPAPALSAGPAGNTTKPVCAVPRLNPRRQVLQPTRQQVEWAADLAVKNELTVKRPADYANMGLPAYEPDRDIPAPALVGGGTIPPQILLGLLAQESNFLEASFHALPGIAGDPLVADYYGAGFGGINVINYDNADCGYGIGQVTTGMTFADSKFWGGPATQAKIAVDYAENIAAAVNLLSAKWNQLARYSPAISANDGGSRFTENWYLALWAYNSGLDPQASTGNTTGCTPGPNCTDAPGNGPGGHWGLGWTNNPENTDWKPDRAPFLGGFNYADAAHPQDWPYQEKVLGWSAVPLLDYTGTPSYRPTSEYPPIAPFPTFCTGADSCDTRTAKNCTLSNFHCWWHSPVSWVKTCSAQTPCVTGLSTYSSGAPEPATNDPHPPDCNSALPSDATIVDNEPADFNLVGCRRENWTSRGSFRLTQGTNSGGTPISVIDTHQLGAGFGGHIFFAHDRAASDAGHRVSGTWRVALPAHAYHVLVHIPSTGGTTTSAIYRVLTSDKTTFSVVVDQYQQQNQWVGLGYFEMGANAAVLLDNVTLDGAFGAHDVAFDAVAFVPVPGRAVNHTFDAVSLFDWNQNLNTPTPSAVNTPARTMKTLHDWAIDFGFKGPLWNNGSQFHFGVSSMTKCPAIQDITSSCVPPDVWNVGRTWANNAIAAGTEPSKSSTPVMTEPTWLAFSNPTPGPAKLTSSTYSSDTSYKIKTHIEISFVVRGSTIVPGSEQVNASVRTGDTELPAFVGGFMKAVQKDYGVAAPDLRYEELDANEFTGDATAVDPLGTGLLNGRAYVWHSDPATISPNHACVGARTITGGSIGWRPLSAQAAVAASVSAWVSKLQNDGAVNKSVTDMAGEIYNFFFKQGITGTVFQQAPPIWQEVHLQVCTSGSISSTAEEPDIDDTPEFTLVDQSYMPDLYLYYDGHLVTNSGKPTTKPVQRGNFFNFSNAFFDVNVGVPYGPCETGQFGNKGNPWNIGLGAPANAIPLTGNFCDNPGEDFGSPFPGG